ncbi:hypothetical protein LFM56_11905 [Cellulomonas iranensis]|uniref:hypothetical protein n=1 Tax=Cellulomonas iranensis TaxID=76862 RepID=UPI001CF3B071|nr:hypothetical protein [Cellulomonas iranensis]UCN13609.1 hypothetical protein LFM56_11905 [Cellulomonas iranensis]
MKNFEKHNPNATIGGPAKYPLPTPQKPPRIRCPRELRGWRFSPHARASLDARGFDPHQVVATCEAPEITVTAYNYGPGRIRFIARGLVVIAVPGTRQIVTALLRSHEQWDDDDARRASEAPA